MTQNPIRDQFPLHWSVYLDDVEGLINEITKLPSETAHAEVNKKDCRGRTPLMLAVTLGHKQCAFLLLEHGADADTQNKEMWFVSHEAIAQNDGEIIREIIKYRDFQRSRSVTSTMRNHLNALKDTRDFYCEMSWEFSSWVPFVSKLCPSDTYKIYKQGSSIRIDTTLIAFEGSSWKRGNQTFIFRLNSENIPQFIVLDHEAQTISVSTLRDDETLEDFDPSPESVHQRLATPISSSFIDVEKIGFERSRGGLLSWLLSAERAECIDGYDCKVFDASNVSLITKTRTEHLTDEAKASLKESDSATSNALNNLLNMIRSETNIETKTNDVHQTGLTATEYLNPDFPLDCPIGKAMELSTKSNTFKATLWLADGYPLDLHDQVIRIVDLMASSSAHFSRLNEFIQMQLPAGFPVKIEIPLFHVVSAKITFGKINEPGKYVTPLETESNFKVTSVAISDDAFELPAFYRTVDDNSTFWWPEDEADVSLESIRHGDANTLRYASPQMQEEVLLQMAIRQSLSDNGGPVAMDDNMLTDDAFAAAISSIQVNRESNIAPLAYGSLSNPLDPYDQFEDDLVRTLRVSEEEATLQRANEEQQLEKEIRKAIQLSLLEHTEPNKLSRKTRYYQYLLSAYDENGYEEYITWKIYYSYTVSMYSVAARLIPNTASRILPKAISHFSSQTSSNDSEQLTLKARKFANDVLRPMVVEQDQKRDISQNMLNELMESRLMALMIPKKYGGEAGTFTNVACVIEELSRVDPSIGMLTHVQSSLIAPLLINHGSEDQKEKYLTKMHNEWFGSLCVTEPFRGSDASCPGTIAKEDGDDYIIHGTKTWIVNSTISQFFVVAAQTEPVLGPNSVTMFIVDKGTPGLKIDKISTKAGFRSLPVGPVDFINVRVPKSAMLGGCGNGLNLFDEAMGFGRIGISAQSVGIAQGSLEATMEQIKDKVTSGTNITSHQAIQHQLAKCATWISAARFLYQNAAQVQANNENFVTESCMAKYFSYQMCRYVTSELMEVVGGETFMNDDNAVSRFHRESIVGGVCEGNANLMLNVIANRLIKNTE